MSLFSKLKKAVKKVGQAVRKTGLKDLALGAASFIPGPIGLVAKAGSAIKSVASTLPPSIALGGGGIPPSFGATGGAASMAFGLNPIAVGGAIGTGIKTVGKTVATLPGAGTVIQGVKKYGGKALGVAGVAATGAAIYDEAGNLLGYAGKRRRRMNYMNMRAAQRAARRVKGSMKLLRKLERSLPKQKTAGNCGRTKKCR